jgi:translation initiation factor 3 subunit D
LGVLGYKPRDFAAQMNLNIANGWGIVRTIVDMVLKMDDGKFVLVKDPNKSVVRLYAVPEHSFDEDESVAAEKPEEEAEE